jgi:hypothetical protein
MPKKKTIRKTKQTKTIKIKTKQPKIKITKTKKPRLKSVKTKSIKTKPEVKVIRLKNSPITLRDKSCWRSKKL